MGYKARMYIMFTEDGAAVCVVRIHDTILENVALAHHWLIDISASLGSNVLIGR